MLAELLAEPGVVERCELGAPFGFMAVHGGSLERRTDHIAMEAARRSGASLYVIQQPAGFRWHVPAIAMDPADSPQLDGFLRHVQVVVSVHGFGSPALARALLLGGSNRELAARLAQALRPALPGFRVIDDLAVIPRRLRGLHPANPVNRPVGGGVQLECCPSVRDAEAATETLIDTLARVARGAGVDDGP